MYHKPWIKIESNGEIETAALNLIGASTKDESHIGFFGTGLKYSIAWLLRNGIEFHLFSGTERIPISTQSVEFRGQTFDRVFINGEPTSMTTEMGKNWKPWFIIRELYSNALDEGQASIEEAEMLDGQSGVTRIFIKNVYEFQYVMENFNKHFFDGEVNKIFTSHAGEIYEYHSQYIGFYRKGINVFEPESYEQGLKAAFIYNSYSCYISETRVASTSCRNLAICNLVLRSFNSRILRGFLLSMHQSNTLESTIAPYEFSLTMFSDSIDPSVWSEALKGFIVYPEKVGLEILDPDETYYSLAVKDNVWQIITTKLDKSQYEVPRRMQDKDYATTQLEDWEEELLFEQLAWFQLRGLDFNSIAVEVVQFLSPHIHGKALPRERKILIGRETLSKGISEVRKTLLEEYVHLKSGAEDCTRSMQNALIDEIITLLERQ